jgi:hypothetical protein
MPKPCFHQTDFSESRLSDEAHLVSRKLALNDRLAANPLKIDRIPAFAPEPPLG